MSEEIRYRILKLLEQNPAVSQRQLAKELGVSVGKANYCLNALIGKGWIKAGNFSRSDNKRAYAYLLTPKGFEEKARVTLRFLRRKQQEYDSLVAELEELRREAVNISRMAELTGLEKGKQD